MERTELERERIRAIVEAAADALDGDWVLVGGALVALWTNGARVTEDIDLVALSTDPARRYELFELAAKLGLPVEALNSAADFFLRREPGFERELEELHVGARGRILRPTPTLFLLLKCGRMSEADLDDCLGVVRLARASGLALDVRRVVARIDALGASAEEVGAGGRRARLKSALLAEG